MTTPTPEEQLKQLQWMIGDWVDESPEALVVTSYRWTDNQCYILSEFKVQSAGRPEMTGTQRIGWDPLAKTIRSWVFDSEGGFGEGTWTRDGDHWIVKRTGVTARREDRLGDERHHPRVQGPHDVAIAGPHRRRGEDARRRGNPHHPQTARTQ